MREKEMEKGGGGRRGRRREREEEEGISQLFQLHYIEA